MAKTLPKGFTDLATAQTSTPNTFLSIIGIVVDLMPPTTTAKGQYMLTFKLLDERLRNSIYGNEGLTVRFFKSDLKALPQVKQYGDVVLLRNTKITQYSNQIMAMSNYQTETTVFPYEAIPEPNFEVAYQGKHRVETLGVPLDVNKLTLEEQNYVVALKHELDATVQSAAARMPLPKIVVAPEPPPGAPTGPALTSRMPSHRIVQAPDPPPGAPTGPATERPRLDQYVTASASQFPVVNKKSKLISELQLNDFADICAQVVKKYPTPSGACELYVTDYTENKDMFYYTSPEESGREQEGDTFGYSGPPRKSWRGPYGQFVLKIEVWEPHAHYANREVAEGDFIELKNVRVKFNQSAKLEGNLWPDNKNPAKVLIIKLKNPQATGVSSILHRKEEYWAACRREDPELEQPEVQALSKNAKRKLKKERLAKDRNAEKTTGVTIAANGKLEGLTDTGNHGAVNAHSKADVNQHIRCSYEEVPISSIKYILDAANDRHSAQTPDGIDYVLPFVNAKYRARVRVMDYEPKKLEDFAVPELRNDDDQSQSGNIMDWESSAKFEWSFALQLENASKSRGDVTSEDQVWVNVTHSDAQYLFGNDLEDPADLDHHPRLLSKLRQKLCILWGNLEERTEGEHISNRPFECCLAEYGVETDDDDPEKASSLFGFRRMYSLFGVTIL